MRKAGLVIFGLVVACGSFSAANDATPTPDAKDAGTMISSSDGAMMGAVDAGCASTSFVDAFDGAYSAEWTGPTLLASSTLGIATAFNDGAPQNRSFLHVNASSTDADSGQAFLTHKLDGDLRSAQLDFDFAWLRIDGYSEFGCVLQVDTVGNDGARIELRRDARTSGVDAPIDVFSYVTHGTVPEASTKFLRETNALPMGTWTHISVTAQIQPSGTVAFAMVLGDGTTKENVAVGPFELGHAMTGLSVMCGVNYAAAPDEALELGFDSFTLTTCSR